MNTTNTTTAPMQHAQTEQMSCASRNETYQLRVIKPSQQLL